MATTSYGVSSTLWPIKYTLSPGQTVLHPVGPDPRISKRVGATSSVASLVVVPVVVVPLVVVAFVVVVVEPFVAVPLALIKWDDIFKYGRFFNCCLCLARIVFINLLSLLLRFNA